jgi:hypothetical protein
MTETRSTCNLCIRPSECVSHRHLVKAGCMQIKFLGRDPYQLDTFHLVPKYLDGSVQCMEFEVDLAALGMLHPDQNVFGLTV